MESGQSALRFWSAFLGDAWRPGGLALTDRAVSVCDFPAQARLGDVGCGLGATVDHLRNRYGFKAWGMDISMEALAGGQPGFRIQTAAETLPLSSESLDGLFCECMLSLLAFPGSSLREFNRVLQRNGALVISDLYLRRPVEGLNLGFPPGHSCLGGAMGSREWTAQVEEAGFELLCWEDHSFLLAELTARLVWELGSREALFENLFPCSGPGYPGKNLSWVRPGYFLLIARKKAENR